jgi:glycosyltransferase involved in cell wall biosynthesis
MVRGRLHGISRYALELAKRLPLLAPDWEFVGLTPPDGLPDTLGELAPKIPLWRAAAPFLSLREQLSLPSDLRKVGGELFHATSFSVPALWKGRLVATLHDANHLALSQFYGRSRRAYYRHIVGPRCRSAAALITVSRFSAAELSRYLSIPAQRFHVVWNGVDERFVPPSEEDAAKFRQWRGLPEKYIAATGNLKPHKNLALLKEVAPKIDVPLALLAGPGACAALSLPAPAMDVAELPEAEMPLFYGAASALLLPSLYEGFGLPMIEAMASGCPVIASEGSALSEIGGNAVTLVPGGSPDAWVQECRALLQDESLRQETIARGRVRAAAFSWDDCARRTLSVYRRALD